MCKIVTFKDVHVKIVHFCHKVYTLLVQMYLYLCVSIGFMFLCNFFISPKSRKKCVNVGDCTKLTELVNLQILHIALISVYFVHYKKMSIRI